MSEPTTCPTCGSAVPPGSPGGACPRCLLAAGLEGTAADGAAPPPPEEMNRHFPQLEVLEVLGQGGMGIVYKARHRNLDRMVALKVLTPEAAQESGFADRFTREARTLARLQHPHIVGVHDFGEAGGLYYLVMEFVDGPTLRQVIREGSLEPRQAMAIVPQVCDALQYAHDQGIVHRDIKPENILLDREGRVKIADFGLAKIVQRAPVDLTLTREGQVMGTLHYMAPEQYRAPDTVDHRADIYSLGVVFYEMLTGDLPMGVFPPPSRRTGVDARLDGVVLRALEKERDRRWQHASDVRTQVDSIAAGAAPTSVDGAASPPPAAAAAAAPDGTKHSRVKLGPLEVDVEKGPDGEKVRVAGLGLDVEEVRAAGGEVEEDGEGNLHFTFRKGSRPPGPDARTSRLALLGAAALPGCLAVGALAAWIHRLDVPRDLPGSLRWGAAAALAAALAGWISSIAGWSAIRHSRGRLRGTGWAAAGTIGIPLLLCAGVPASWVLLGTAVRTADGPPRLPPVRPGVVVDARASTVSGGPPTMTPLHRTLVAGEMEEVWAREGTGLIHQMTGEARGPWGWGVRAVALDSDGRRGRVVVSDGKETMAFPVVLDGERWTVPEGDREMRPGGFRESDRDGRVCDDLEEGAAPPPAGGGRRGLVFGGPPGMTGGEKDDVLDSVLALWSMGGASFVEKALPGHGLEARAAAFAPWALVLQGDLAAGRLVLTDGSSTLVVPLKAEEGFWRLEGDGTQFSPRPPVEGDRDGWLSATGYRITRPDDSHLVSVAPDSMTDREKGEVVAAVRALWKEKGPEYVRRPMPNAVGDGELRVPGNASDWTLFAVALDEGGSTGRAVLGNGTSALSVPVERDGEVWVLGASGWALRFSPPTEADRDGELFR